MERLRFAREFYKMSFKQLERETRLRTETGISVWTIRSHFEGKTCPSAAHFVMYADVFGVSLDFFTELDSVRRVGETSSE